MNALREEGSREDILAQLERVLDQRDRLREENRRLRSEVTGLKAEIVVLEAERIDQTPKLPTWQKSWYDVGIDTGRIC